MKLQQFDKEGQSSAWLHFCPGCKWMHVIYTDPKAQPNGHVWQFDGNMEAPTFSPSVNIVGQCHYYLRAGRIEFMSDCRHTLAGQTVDLPDIPEDW